MKTKLPLPTETKLQNDKPIKDNRILGWPFELAAGYGVTFYESDLKYINNVIKSDKIYRMIIHAQNLEICGTNNPDNYGKEIHGIKMVSSSDFFHRLFIEKTNLIQFLNKFLDDPKCPIRVKGFLCRYIGRDLGCAKVNGTYKIFLQRSFLAERWLEICR